MYYFLFGFAVGASLAAFIVHDLYAKHVQKLKNQLAGVRGKMDVMAQHYLSSMLQPAKTSKTAPKGRVAPNTSGRWNNR